jgi:hypothetical protein
VSRFTITNSFNDSLHHFFVPSISFDCLLTLCQIGDAFGTSHFFFLPFILRARRFVDPILRRPFGGRFFLSCGMFTPFHYMADGLGIEPRGRLLGVLRISSALHYHSVTRPITSSKSKSSYENLSPVRLSTTRLVASLYVRITSV